MNRTFSGVLRATLISGVLLALGSGCGGGSSVFTQSGGTRSGKYLGKLTSVVVWKMPASDYDTLSATARAALQQKGMTFDDTTKTLTSAELPLIGHLVKIGDRFCMTDQNGVFTVDSKDGEIPKGGNAPVFNQTDSPQAEGVVALEGLVPEGQTPAPVRLSLAYSPEESAVAAALHSGRAQTAPDGCSLKDGCLPPGHPDGNKQACCLDYNGDGGDGLARQRAYGGTAECVSKATDNYINSTCFHWTFDTGTRPCAGEGPDVDNGNRCWLNHRYRNCQNIVEGDLNVTTQVRVPLGGHVTFKIRNNTEANASILSWEEASVPGSLELEPGLPSSQALLENISGGNKHYVLQHFNTSRQEHYEDVTLAYNAPSSLPEGKSNATYHLTVAAGGLTMIVEVIVGEEKEIEITPATSTIKPGETIQLTAIARDAQGNTIPVDFEWSASNPNIADVNQSGFVSASSEGQSIVTVRIPGPGDIRATAVVTVKEDEPTPPAQIGTYNLVSVNGSTPPKVINEYYDEDLDYTFKTTIFSGFFKLGSNGTFERESKGGDLNFPVTIKGSGTYKVEGSKIKFTYTSGNGPAEVQITGSGKFSITNVFPADEEQGGHFPHDVTVTEVYSL